MAIGLLERDAGEVRVDGREIRTTSTDAKAAIGYVPQDIAIYPDLTARENLMFFGHLYGMTGRDLAARVDEVLETIGLRERAKDRSGEFSGGMKRRLNIGIGLLHKPRLLMLDEPTVGVDPQSRNAILESVEQLSAAGMAVLYTTHYMEEAERLCDRVGIIDEGEIKAEGTRAELVRLVGERDKVRLTASGHLGGALAALRAIPGVQEATAGEEGIDLLVTEADRALAAILAAAAGAGVSVHSVDGGRAQPRSRLPPPDRQGAARVAMAALRIALKDMRQRLRDRSVYLWGIVAPLGLAAIFSLLFSAIWPPGSPGRSRIAVADQDGGQRPGRSSSRCCCPSTRRGCSPCEEVASAAEARQTGRRRRGRRRLRDPGGLQQRPPREGAASAIEVVANVDSPIAGQVARAVAGQFVGRDQRGGHRARHLLRPA